APPADHVSFDELMAKAAQSRKAGRYQEAINYYGQALNLRRGDGKALGGLVDAYHDLGGFFFKRGQDISAARAFPQGLNLRADEGTAHLKLRGAYSRISEDYKKAIAPNNKAIKLSF